MRISDWSSDVCSSDLKGPDVHLVMDNYATHKTRQIKAWLARRPHWHAHCTPTSPSWINQVERWFAELTRQPSQRRLQRPHAELETDITAFMPAHSETHKQNGRASCRESVCKKRK